LVIILFKENKLFIYICIWYLRLKYIKYLNVYTSIMKKATLKIKFDILFQVFLKLFNTSCIKNTDSFISDFVLRPETNINNYSSILK